MKLSYCYLWLLLCTPLLFTACAKDDTPVTPGGTDTTTAQKHHYVMFTLNLSDGTGFLTPYDAIPTGDVDNSAGPGAKQVSKFGFVKKGARLGKSFFATTNLVGEPGIEKLEIDGAGKVQDKGFIPTAKAPNLTVVSDTKGYFFDKDRGTMKLQIFNPTTMARTGEIDLSSLSRGQVLETVGLHMLVARDGKVFADLYYSDDAAQSVSNYKFDTAYMAVIDVASNTLEKVIGKPDMQGVGYNGYDSNWDIDEKGDLYLGTFGNFFVTDSKDFKGRIARIPKGSIDFDDFLLKGNDYQRGAFLQNFGVQDGKIYVSIPNVPILTDLSNDGTDIYTSSVIDIKTKVATPITGLPVSNGYELRSKLNGKLYVPAANANNVTFYRLDGFTATEAFRLVAGGYYLGFNQID